MTGLGLVKAPPDATSFAVDLHGLTLSVRCPFAELADLLEARFQELPAAVQQSADIEIVFEKGRLRAVPPDARIVYESELGSVFYSPARDELHARYGECGLWCSPAAGRVEVVVPASLDSRDLWRLSRPLVSIPLFECARRQGLYPIHAACLASGGRGVLIAGPSGAGKTTAALALARTGLDYLSDDLVFLPANAATALAFPDELGLASGVEELFPNLLAAPHIDPPQSWPKARGAASDLVRGRTVPRCEPVLIVVLSREGPPGVAEIGSDEAFRALLSHFFLTDPETCRRHIEMLSDLVRGVPAVKCVSLAVSSLTDLVIERLSAEADSERIHSR